MNNPRLGPLRRFTTIDGAERRYLDATFSRPLSGYLGGIHKGGYWVERLIEEWCATFKCRHAIPCNSATSGLLAACLAAGIRHEDLVWTSVYTMSATASCAKMLGADVQFIDIETARFSMNMSMFPGGKKPKAIIVTNLFGHPAYVPEIRAWCDVHGVVLIEDNAQAPFAMIGKRYTGTIGHIGVFSLNVHKHIQCGEGGVVVTDDPDFAARIHDAVNHGELRQGGKIGLNLRMTEPIAAMACVQLNKGPAIIEDRRALALAITDMVTETGDISPPKEAFDCKSVYYIWAGLINAGDRKRYVAMLNEHGVPMREGYAPLLSRVFGNPTTMVHPTAQKTEDKEIITFEICAYNPTGKQMKIMKEIFKIAGDALWH